MRETWAEWTDVLGNTYKPGDIVAIATVSGRSPQLVIAKVVSINKTDKEGNEITARKWVEHDEPIMRTRIRRSYNYNTNKYDDITESYLEEGGYKQVPSCTVTAQPLMDTRKFYRATDQDGKHKKVTYSVVENIVKLEAEWLDE